MTGVIENLLIQRDKEWEEWFQRERQKVRQEVLQEVLQEVRQEERLALAAKLMKTRELPLEKIMELTGLTESQLSALTRSPA